MKKRKLLFAMLCIASALGMRAQTWTDVTSTYITNASLVADYYSSSNNTLWPVYTTGRTGNTQHPKNWYLHTNGTTNHNINTGTGFFECWTANQGVKRWTLFQDVTLPAGTYRLTGQYSTNENRGIIKTVAITPHHSYFSPGITTGNWGSWGSQTAEFTIYEETKVRVGMISTNFAQNHGFTLETTGAKQLLADEIAAATADELSAAKATAQGVYDDGASDDAAYRSAAKTLHDAIVAYNIENASAGSPVDMTDYITDPSFEGIANAVAYTGNKHNLMSAWSAPSVTDGGARSLTGNDYLITDNSEDGFYAVNLWNSSATTYYVQQTISGLPVGRYVLTATYASDASNTATLSMASTESTITATNKGHFVEGSVTYNHTATGDVIIKLNSSKWFKADNFKLSYLGDPLKAVKAELAALQATIDDDYLDDTTYENVVGTERTDLNAAKSTTAATEDLEGYEAAITSVQNAIDAFVAAKTNYDALADINALISSVGTLSYADSSKKPSSVSASSASDADTQTASQTLALRAYYESHALAEGFVGASDQTSLIGEPIVTATSAGTYSGSAWTTTQLRINAGGGYTDSNGDKKAAYYDASGEFWGSNSVTTSSMSQTLSALPIGRYMLTVCCRGSNTDALESLKLNAADQSLDVTSLVKGSTAIYGDGWNDASLEFTINTKQDVLISFVGKAKENTQGAWFSVDNYRLVKLEALTEAELSDYTALNSAIEAAEAKTLGFENGEYAPYNNLIALEALVAAKALNQSESNAQSYVNSLTTTLTTAANWTANDGDVDAIYNGTFSVANGNNPKGWTRSNNAWGQQITGLTDVTNGVAEGTTTAWYYNTNGSWQYGNDGIYTMPLAGDQAYKLTFKYAKHENDGHQWMKASVTNSSDNTDVPLNAVQYPGSNDNTNYMEVAAYFTTRTAGNYILSLEQNGNVHLTDVSLVKATSATLALDEDESYTPVDRTYYETVTLDRTIKANKWNTFCVPFNMTAEEITAKLGATAEVKELTTATATQNGDNYTLTFGDASSIVAGNPYMVRVTGESDITSISLTGKTISSTITPTVAGGVTFTGVYTNGFAPLNSFIISNNVFYQVDTDANGDGISEVALKAFRGYITVSGASVKAVNFEFDDDATGINSLTPALSEGEGAIYNLAGQRMNKMQKGINIVNGKKIMK